VIKLLLKVESGEASELWLIWDAKTEMLMLLLFQHQVHYSLEKSEYVYQLNFRDMKEIERRQRMLSITEIWPSSKSKRSLEPSNKSHSPKHSQALSNKS
jgi:hypothetical protein